MFSILCEPFQGLQGYFQCVFPVSDQLSQAQYCSSTNRNASTFNLVGPEKSWDTFRFPLKLTFRKKQGSARPGHLFSRPLVPKPIAEKNLGPIPPDQTQVLRRRRMCLCSEYEYIWNQQKWVGEISGTEVLEGSPLRYSPVDQKEASLTLETNFASSGFGGTKISA